jgi:uracil-DNA glycosylase
MLKFYPYGKISQDHGKARIVEYNKKQYILIPMYHPAAALRGAVIEQALRADFKNIPLEIERLEKNMAKQPEVVIKQLSDPVEEQLLLA